ncbi:MAG TPA: M48 family metalloprotease, partial [Gemmatimonadaceae bacterium]|nr:M48 family metalloprotease [Gemmatimonadaceae bacterium]
MAHAVERVHFLAEQHRNRRRSARFSVFAVVAVALAGIPLCVILAPFLYGVVLVAAHAGDLVAPLSSRQWEVLHEVAFALPAVWKAVRGEPTRVTLGTLAMLYVAPGAVTMLVAWPLVRLLSRVGGAGTVLRRLPSREPDAIRLPDQQLRNLVQEIAVAAGVRPPAVRIIDSPAVNAVAVGLTTDDATILVTAGFLHRLDRDQRQAIIAHLVGSIGNGDLEIAATILSVFQTWGLMALLLETPLDARRRVLVRQFVRLSLDAVRGRADPEAARAMLDSFLASSALVFDEFFENLDTIRPESVGHACAVIVIHIPLIATIGLASIAAKQSIGLFTNLILGPWLAPMWRARRRLADATAVQLTRNPDALARAIRDLDAADVKVDGGEAVNFLFPVWPGPSKATMTEATD